MCRSWLVRNMLAVIWCLPVSLPVAASVPPTVIAQVKGTVVNIEKYVAHALGGERARRTRATGFVVDTEQGVVVTNRHVAGTSPAQIFITFENGERTPAKIRHYDAIHDFAFLSYDPAAIEFDPPAARLGSAFSLAEQDHVAMIGNNDVQEYSVKFGRVTNLRIDKGNRHTGTFQTSFDRAGGSSGSPVVDASGTVVGVHFAGTSTTSFEMYIDYVVDALRQLQGGNQVGRGDIGVELGLMHLSDARKHFSLPASEAEAIRLFRSGSKHAIYVDRVVPLTPADRKLFPGDLVIALNDHPVVDDLYRFDQIVDAAVGSDIEMTVYRGGKRMMIRLPVSDAEALKTRHFVLFAGGVLHDVTPGLRLRYDVRSHGTWLSQANPGTSIAEVGSGRERSPGSRSVLIEQINGVPTPNLDTLVDTLRPLSSGDDIFVVFRDFRSSRRTSKVEWLTLDLKYSPLRSFEWQPGNLEWVELD